MQDLNNLHVKKKANFEYSGGPKKKVIQLDSYYLQGGKWRKVSEIRTRFSDKKEAK